MKSLRAFAFTLLAIGSFGYAQAQETWTLQRCIEYANEHNIQIKQQLLQTRLSELTLQQSRLSQLPTLNGGMSYGRSFGRSIDPTSNQFVSTQFSNAGANVNLGLDIFSWFQKRNTIAANRYSAKAGHAIEQRLKNDIYLNVAAAYLQILVADEQLKASEGQVKLTTAQLTNTSQRVDAGSLPESNRADLVAQLARDSATLITARNNVTTAVLQMKALLNLDFATSFVAAKPDMEKIPILDIATLEPEQIYQEAVNNQPQVLADSLLVLAAQKQLAATKGGLYPSLGIGGGLGTNYSSTFRSPTGTTTLPPVQVGSVTVGNTEYPVYSLPQTVTNYGKPSLGSQLNNNLNESVGIQLNIPIFNGWQTRTQVRRAKIDLENQRLIQDQDLLTLRQNIYQAYADARTAMENYNAAQKTLKASETSFYYAEQRYQLGLINSVEYLTTQNNLFQAQTDLIAKHYDYIFKMKVLEFYRNLNVAL